MPDIMRGLYRASMYSSSVVGFYVVIFLASSQSNQIKHINIQPTLINNP